jgi:hypothetical protein
MGRDALKELQERISVIDRRMNALNEEKKAISKDIEFIKKTPKVSDHAVIRYLERKMNFDFEDIRAKLLTPTVVSAMEIGVEGIKIDGGTLKIRDKTVVTFIGK